MVQEQITDETVEWAKSFGEFLQSDGGGTKPLTTSQIRRFFGELKRIQAAPDKNFEEIPLLKAKLAYAVGRDARTNREGQLVYGTKLKQFYEELERGINAIRRGNADDVIRFVKIVESIVAFHKFFGGK